MSYEAIQLQHDLLELTADVLSVEYGVSIPDGATYIKWQSAPGSLREAVQFSPLKLAQPQPDADEIVSAQIVIGDGGEAVWLSRDAGQEQSATFLRYFLERFHEVWRSHDHSICLTEPAPARQQVTLYRLRGIDGQLLEP